MLDVSLWSKFYWENETNHWKNLANELKQENPYEYAIKVCQRIQKINDDYFQECSEGSPGYHPSIELDKKFKSLKRDLGDKIKNIPIKNFILQLKEMENKGVIFFYYFEKQTQLKEGTKIVSYLDNYNEVIINYLKGAVVKETDEKELILKNRLLENELTKILEVSTEKNIKFVLNFFDSERYTDWFKKNLDYIISYKSFIVYNAHLIDETKEDMIEWSQFLKKNTKKDSLAFLNSNLLGYLNYFEQENRAIELIKNLPVEYGSAFKSLVFSDLNTVSMLEKWYELVLRDKTHERDFYNQIWKNQEESMKLSMKLNQDSLLLDFLANKMSKVYSREEVENFDFTQSIINNENMQEIMQKKLAYYHLDNKLTPNNKKYKNIKI